MATTNVITSLGAADIDTKALAAQLVEAVKAPRQKLIDQDKKKAEVAVSQLALLKNGLAGLSQAASDIAKSSNLNKSIVTSSNTSVVTASSDPSSIAIKGTYSVKIETLAEPRRYSAAFPRAWGATEILAIDLSSLPKAAESAPYLEIPVGSTPAAITAAINTWIDEYAPDSDVTATLIDTKADTTNPSDAPLSIVLGGPTGLENDFSLNFLRASVPDPTPDETTDWELLNEFVYNFESINEPKDAVFQINNVRITRPSNTITDVIAGISLTLNAPQSGSDAAITIKATPDASSVLDKLQNFVDTFNVINAFLKKATGPKIEGDELAGSLSNNSVAKSALRQLRSAVTRQFDETPNSIKTLNSLGIRFDRLGTLTLDPKEFSDKFESSAKDVVTVLGNNTDGPYLGTLGVKAGLAGYIANLSANMTSSAGVISSMTKGYDVVLSKVKDQQSTLDRYIERLTEQYDKQFASLNNALSAFKATSAQLEKSLNLNND